MPRDIPHNIEELLECQTELVHTSLGEAPIFREMFSAMVEAAETQRTIKLRSTVREGSMTTMDPFSYDEGFKDCLTFLTDLIRKEE